MLAVAAPIEVRGVLAGLSTPDTPIPALWEVATVTPQVHVLHTGVSKSNAAGALATTLHPNHPYGAVLSLGIAGALPGSGLKVRQSITATACMFADEGLVTVDGFQTLANMGFPVDSTLEAPEAIPTAPVLQHVFRSETDAAGTIATVSTCSGTDAIASEVVRRTGALAETMEGAALALIARRRGIPYCEVRTISNHTGERAAQQWDIPGAVARLSDIVRAVIA